MGSRLVVLVVIWSMKVDSATKHKQRGPLCHLLWEPNFEFTEPVPESNLNFKTVKTCKSFAAQRPRGCRLGKLREPS